MNNTERAESYDVVNQTDAATILGVHRMTIWQWIKDGKIKAVLVGGLRMIPQSEIKRLKQEINNQTAGAMPGDSE